MSPLEYIGSAFDDWPLYLVLATLFLTLHALLIRRWAVGFYDPLFVLLVSHALGWTIVWFMFLRGDIAWVYALSFSSAQAALYLGMGIARLRGNLQARSPMPAGCTALPALTLSFAILVNVTTTLAIWALAGIPLLRDSRLGAFQGSGGLGILERLAESSGMIAVFTLVFIGLPRRKLRAQPMHLLAWSWLLATIGLSGSKGALLTLVQCVLSVGFIYGNLHQHKARFWGGNLGKLLVVVTTLFSLAVLALQHEGDLVLAGIGLLYRIVSYGDIYIFAYPDSTIEALKGSNPLVGMFGGFLSTFRLFPQELLHTNLGYQLVGIIFPDLDLVVGPNPQHPVFGSHYFGPFGFVFSFAVGLLTMAVHTRFYFRQHSSFIVGMVWFMAYFSLFSVSMDFDYSMFKLANTIIGLVVIVGPALLLNPQAVLWRRDLGQGRHVKLREG